MTVELVYTIYKPYEQDLHNEFPSLSIEYENALLTDSGMFKNTFWVECDTTVRPNELETFFEQHKIVDRFEVLDRGTESDNCCDGYYYMAVYDTEHIPDLYRHNEELGIVVEEYAYSNGGLRHEVCCPDRETTQAHLRRIGSYEGWSVDVHSVAGDTDGNSEDHSTLTLLTDKQRETLKFAHESGYFETPRGISLAEIGEAFDISAEAASSRIRRGTDTLIDAQFSA